MNQLKWGALLSYLQMGMSIVIGVLYTPIMLRILGQSEYGLYNTVASTIATLSILNLGFSSGYIRYFSEYRRENQKEHEEKLNGLFIIIFTIIGLIAFACGLFLTANIELIYDHGLSEQEMSRARVLMFLMTINLSLSFPMSVFQTIISANEKFVFLKLIGTVSTVLSPLVTLPILLMGYRSIAMVIISLSLNVVIYTAYAFYVLKVLKCRFRFTGLDIGVFKSLFGYTFFIALNLIIDQINWNIDKILLGRFRGTVSVAVYSVGYSLYNYYMMFSVAVSSVFTPKIHRIIQDLKDDVVRQKSELTALFIRVGRIQFLLLALMVSGVVFFGREFIYYWAGDGYEDSYPVALLLMIPGTVPLIQNLGIEIQRAQNKHQFRSIVYSIMAIINLVLSIYLCQIYGAIGSAFGTAVSFVIANGFIMNVYYNRKCNIDIPEFWKSIISIMPSMLPSLVLGVVIFMKVEITSLLMLLGLIMGYTVVYCISVWLFGMNDFEKELVAGPVRRFVRGRTLTDDKDR